ncbi:MAG: hypothetical protein AB2792_09945 [Candidatus Thiodiazotropha sp.]
MKQIALFLGSAVKGVTKFRRALIAGQYGAVGGIGSSREFRKESSPISQLVP